MKHVINAYGTTVTAGIKNYIEEKFSKFEKYLNNDVSVKTNIHVKDNNTRHKVEVTLFDGKRTIRVESNTDNMYSAIDAAEKKMSEVLRKRKEKRIDRHQKKKSIDQIVVTVAEDPEASFVRAKAHHMDVKSADEAGEAMELGGHNFYVYKNMEYDKVCAVYKREDGTYGDIVYNED